MSDSKEKYGSFFLKVYVNIPSGAILDIAVFWNVMCILGSKIALQAKIAWYKIIDEVKKNHD